MSAVDWLPSRAFVWLPDNDGQRLHTDANDSGGATNMGITHATWDAAVEQGLVSGSLADATLDQLGLILRVNYWNAVQGDLLSPGVDLATFNMAMVAGSGGAAYLLQQALGFTGSNLDRHIGPMTLGAVNKTPPAKLIVALTVRDEAYFAGLSSFRWFGRGWDRRADDCEKAALGLLKTPMRAQSSLPGLSAKGKS